jgi:4-amino-4-deoxy-L-arabinose transferase-like glycosyltransferase
LLSTSVRDSIDTVTTKRLTRLPVFICAAGVTALLIPFAGRYGYNDDELYYRLLGEHGLAWGYTDQPPLVPLLIHGLTSLFGDSLWAIRVPTALCAATVVVLGSLITAEFGGSRRAQAVAAFGLGTSFFVLGVGHVLITTTLDMVAWCLVFLFVSRALLRNDGKWWLAAGGACGLATYAKYIVLLLPASLLVGLLLVGPRSVFRDRRLYLGAGLALVAGAPNFIYQAVHNFPQLQMAHALAATDGPVNRVVFLPTLLILLGLALTPIWLAGLIKLFRQPSWRPARALGVAWLAAMVLLIVVGGRPDYLGGFLLGMFAAGCVVTDRWMAHRRWRLPVVGAALALSALLQIVMALPVLPVSSVAQFPVNDIAVESVGWPTLVAQVARAYHGLPAGERGRAIVLAGNIGEAGAVNRFGGQYGLPTVYSGNNQLYYLGPPPESATLVVAVGIGSRRLSAGFARCQVVSHVNNGYGVNNVQQGQRITVCTGRRAPWTALWPAYRYLSG